MTARTKKARTKKDSVDLDDLKPNDESDNNTDVGSDDVVSDRLPGIYLDDLERERRQQLEDDYHAKAKANKDEDDE